jgi:hypothetical protein
MKSTVYELGKERFCVRVDDNQQGMFEAEVYRIGPENIMSQVVFPNGTQFTARGPSAWEAGFRVVQALETYVGARADQLRNYEVSTLAAVGAWALPS